MPTGLLLALLLAACSSSSTPPSHVALPTCTFNIGDTVQPSGSVGARVPELSGSVSGNADKATGGGSSIQIETSKDGVVTITSSKNGVDAPPKVCQLPTAAPSSGIVIRDSSPDEVAQTLYEAQKAGDRETGHAVASKRVVHILFDPLPTEGANGVTLAPGANSLGEGPRPCTGSGDSYSCHFRNSSVTVLIRKERSGRYFAWAVMAPLGGGRWPTPTASP